MRKTKNKKNNLSMRVKEVEARVQGALKKGFAVEIAFRKTWTCGWRWRRRYCIWRCDCCWNMQRFPNSADVKDYSFFFILTYFDKCLSWTHAFYVTWRRTKEKTKWCVSLRCCQKAQSAFCHTFLIMSVFYNKLFTCNEDTPFSVLIVCTMHHIQHCHAYSYRKMPKNV